MRSLHALVATSVMAVLAGSIAGCSKPAPEQAPPPMPVVTVKSETRDIPDKRRYPGNTQAIHQATMVARIEGYLQERLFDEGSDVKEGQLLFVIEQAPYEAAVLANRAAVLDAEVMLDYARTQYERNEPLAKTGAISEQDWDGYVRNLESAVAQLEEAQAALIQSEINLEYTEVRAPFAGRIGERYVDVGNLVGPGTNEKLALVVDLDPMRVVFEPAGTELVDFLKAWPRTTVPVTVTFQSDAGPEVMKGSVDLVNNTLNSATSTFLVRAEFSNPDHMVLPGLFGEVEATVGILKNSIVVPGAAIYSELQDHFVWVVDSKNQLVRKSVTLGRTYESLRIVTGIDAGEEVVVQGNPMAMVNEKKVSPTSKTIDEFLKSQDSQAAQNKDRTKEGSAGDGTKSGASAKDASSGGGSKTTSTKSDSSG